MLVYAKRWIMDSRLVNDYQLVLGYWPSLWIVAKQLDRCRWHLANSLGQVVTSWLDSDWYTIATALPPLWGMPIIVVVSNVVLEAVFCLSWPQLCLLKMIGKGFVLFKINSLPSAFYIIKPTCISRLVFKVNKCLKNCRKAHTQTFVYVG